MRCNNYKVKFFCQFQIQASVTGQPVLHLPPLGHPGGVERQVPDERLLRKALGTRHQRVEERAQDRSAADRAERAIQDEKSLRVTL